MSHIVPVYSIAKSYTAAAALLTFEPTQTVGSVIPDLPEALGRLSIEHLLSHRSGLDDYAAWPEYREAVAARAMPWSARSILNRASVGEPGRFRYSNIGFLLVRLALETAHDSEFHDVLSDLVFVPLGVSAQRFADLDDWDRCDHPAIDGALRSYHPGWVYPGTFATDPDEAARGLALIMRGRLGARLPEQMQRTHLVGVPSDHPMMPNAGYGLGLMTHGIPPTVVGHGGQGPGFNLFAAVSTDGTRWRGAVAAAEGEDLELIRRCVDAVT